MTGVEKQRFKREFPNLDVNHAIVTGGKTNRYNCIAWTMGVTNQWIWPGDNIKDFDAFYKLYGYTRSSDGPIAIWGTSESEITHGCVSGPVNGPRWESKCGGDLKIQHGLNELTGTVYGNVIAFYSREQQLREESVTYGKTETFYYFAGGRYMRITKAQQRKFLDAAVNQIDRQTVEEFHVRYVAWEKTCRHPSIVFLSNPSAVKKNEEFYSLIKMGEDILPLVVQKLIDRKNFFALQIYDALQSETDPFVRYQTERFEGEQKRAERTIHRWIQSAGFNVA